MVQDTAIFLYDLPKSSIYFNCLFSLDWKKRDGIYLLA